MRVGAVAGRVAQRARLHLHGRGRRSLAVPVDPCWQLAGAELLMMH